MAGRPKKKIKNRKTLGKKRLFIDTGAFYARYVVRDAHHEEALRLWDKITQGPFQCLTSNFVLSELITLLIYRFGTRQALQAAREIYASSAIEIISINTDIELKALSFLEKFDDQKLSMTDVTSFALMKDIKIQEAFTFDRDFKLPAFTLFE
jgi:uncharacterized protein